MSCQAARVLTFGHIFREEEDRMELLLNLTVQVADKTDAMAQLEAIHYALRDAPGVRIEPVTLDDQHVDEDLDPLGS
jgi:hypothetical protein